MTALVADLAAGRITVVDLTQPLGPDTPVIGLPPIFAASPGVSIDVISRYDDKGPAWYWNTIRMGEHTGTHFDAPVHWISGRDLPNNTTDTIPRGAVRRSGLRDRRHEPTSRPTKTTCSTSPRSNGGKPRTGASRAARGCCSEPDGAGGRARRS